MPPTATSEPLAPSTRAKASAALFSILAAGIVTALKAVTGILTGSLGMLSEAAHSAIDLIAAVITFISVHIADRPADDDHTYGHGKVESLSAAVEAALMLASALWIIYEAVHRIFFHNHLALSLTPWPFAVLVLSIVVDYIRSRTLRRVAREQQSEALAADALHFSTDIWASLAVILGLAATFAGERLHAPALTLADPIAALVVAAIILRVCWQLTRNTLASLTDATPEEFLAHRTQLTHDLQSIDGVVSVDRIRLRRSGARTFADLTLGISRTLTFQRTQQITDQATAAVQRLLPAADVVVHPVPTADAAESIFDRMRAVAARLNLSTHDLTVQRDHDGLHVEQHLEVDENLPLSQAHDLVTRLESEMCRDLPEIASIVTHIESQPATIEQPATLDSALVAASLRRAAKPFPEILDIHEVVVRRTHGPNTAGRASIYITCHCTLPDALPMARVHAIISAFESAYKANHPEVARVLIHPEPATDNRR